MTGEETFMSPEEFSRLGDRAFGRGWQSTLGAFLGYHRTHINRFAMATTPIPPTVAFSLRAICAMLDNGVVVDFQKPAGRIVSAGRFIPNRELEKTG